MKRSFIVTLCVVASLNGCASFDKGAVIGLIESVVTASIDYLREHPEAVLMSHYSDSSVSVDASMSDVSADRE